jgi:hypothetical protein
MASQGHYPVIYDCIEPSPYYEDDTNNPFIDERDAIELPPLTEQTEGLVNEPYQKRYIFNPLNLPYQLERVYCAISANGADAKSVADKRGMPKLNRYYEKLKPFYKLESGLEHPGPDRTLMFESRFESGNLKRAVKV